MSLFKRVHVVTVPKEYLDEGDAPIQLRFCQLNAKKMAKANEADTIAAIERGNQLMNALSDEQRAAAIERQKTQDAEASKRAQERAEEPDAFDDFDQFTLIRLAHVEHKNEDGDWFELTEDQINDLVCFEWLAGQIYDVSKPKGAKEREKN